MRFEFIHVAGFGRLCDASIHFAPGLNLLYGPNEAGKSTLQQAIWALLYGFYSGERKTRAETDRWERSHPWNCSAHGGHLVYRLDNGRAYRVHRTFASEDLRTAIFDADTGRKIPTTSSAAGTAG